MSEGASATPAREASTGHDGNDPGNGGLLIVGMGASAGGLGALEDFFEHVPATSGMAFVVVTHQPPGRTSLLAEILGRKTQMPVVQVSEAIPVEPDHVYTVPPGHNLAIIKGILQPIEVDDKAAPHMAVDYFFRSLARDQKERAVGIVLSGTGSDGSLGLKDIKGELGMVMVQEEQSAEYSGMPHSAIATERVDYVLPVSEMPEQLFAYARALSPGRRRDTRRAEPPVEALQQIFVLIRDRTGHDFSQYKQSTVGRRIERRMNVHHLDSVKHYMHYLQDNPEEIDLLFKELLIGVTSFFRDAEAWDALSSALWELLGDKPEDHIVRAWVPGCASGEEAYSLAIVLREAMEALKRRLDIQIFATDIDQAAIDVARAGFYPLGIANDVTSTRLSRFFLREDDGYRAKKELREMIVFAPQDLIADPPFTKLDVLSCRNLLIYLDAKLQHRLLPLFHYALKPEGILFLGSSESVGSFTELFSTADKQHRIFRRSEVTSGTYVAEFPAAAPEPGASGEGRPRPSAPGPRTGQPIERAVNRMLLEEMVPPTVLVREQGEVVHVHGRTGLFLEPAPGSQAGANIFNMARSGLQLSLASAVRQAANTGEETIVPGVRVNANGGSVTVDVRVRRLDGTGPLKGLFRVVFDRAHAVSSDDSAAPSPEQSSKPDRHILQLEQELQHNRESHQSTIEELQAANEELKSTNEELQSTNEELQSANEELETSKEEMQSLNEELQTVNTELQSKVEELSRANNDMKNLLNATDIATVFVDNELRIKRFTDQATKVIHLIPTDVGRPIGDLVSTLHYDRLVEDAREVLRKLVFKETEVVSESGAHYLMRILPYRTTENVIDGLVFTFIDVTKLKALQQEQAQLLQALQNSPANVFGQDAELRYTWSCSPAFGQSVSELIGKSDHDLFSAEDAERLARLKSQVLASGEADRRRLELTVGDQVRTYDMYMEPKREANGQVSGVSCVALDITPNV